MSEFYGRGVAEMLADQHPGKIWRIDSPTHALLEERKMKQLFWTAAFYRKGKKTEMVQYPNAELYESEDAARRATIKRIPSSYKERFDRLEVVVRPF